MSRDATARRLHGYRAHCEAAFPQAFRVLVDVHLKHRREFAEWCFLPLRATHHLISQGGRRKKDSELRAYQGPGQTTPIEKARVIEAEHDLSTLHAIACWLPGRTVIELDRGLLSELAQTPVQGEIPAEVFLALPGYGVYIDLQGADFPQLDFPVLGAFVHLDSPDGAGDATLHAVFDTGDFGGPDNMVPVGIRLGGSIEEGLRPIMAHSDSEGMAHAIAPLISVVLYVCSQNADWEREGEKPQRAGAKEVRRAAHPQKAGANTWVLGRRLGAALRRAEEDAAGPPTGRTVRPHVRRGHWHLYWTGKGRQIPVVRYLPPTVVAQDRDGPVVVRRA